MSRKPVSLELQERNSEIGSIIREYRQRSGLGEKQCAKVIDVSTPHYHHLEVGTSMIMAVYVELLAEYLNIPHEKIWPQKGFENSTKVTVDRVEGSRLFITVSAEVDFPYEDE